MGREFWIYPEKGSEDHAGFTANVYRRWAGTGTCFHVREVEPELRRAWPKTIGPYLSMPITFPIWIILRIIDPKGTDTYFIDREPVDQDKR